MTKDQQKLSDDKTQAKTAVEKESKVYKPPKGTKQEWSLNLSGKSQNCTVIADWLLIRKKEKPVADIFFTYYALKTTGKHSRPITFVFNGGPGSSSVYLHIGGIGPKRVVFGKQGEVLPPPAVLEDNPDSWLEFTDLVFIDPVGTGFSRSLEEVDLSPPVSGSLSENPEKQKSSAEQEFYKMNRDLESIGEFIQRFLSQHRRWSSSVYIAGESYGGFRVGKLAKLLQKNYGVGLKGAVLISPVLELRSFSYSDYDNLYWIESFPTQTAVAVQHNKSVYFAGKTMKPGSDLKAFLKPAESFAVNELSSLLTQGNLMEEEKKESVFQKFADFTGLPLEKVKQNQGRVSLFQFCRELLKKDRKWCGIYDASLVSWDPFPDRDSFEGPDPTAEGNERVFTHGINTFFRERLKLAIDRQYRLLNSSVNKQWKNDQKSHFFDLQIGAMDDLRYAMCMNPYMKVLICHGIFDLATPYFASQRVMALMKLPEELKQQLSFRIYHGGHMFYTWDCSRKAFKEDMLELYK